MYTLVDSNDQYTGSLTKSFKMIDNYVYLYHTDTLIAIPMFPESVQDTMNVAFSSTHPLSRSAPIFSYQNSGPRSFQVSLLLHRDMMNQINTSSSTLKISNLEDEDYVDIMIKQLQAMALPSYAASEKMVNPPLIAVRFGTDLFCKGVVNGSVSVTYSGPILRTNKYAQAEVAFNVSEVDPYDAETVMLQGGFRGIRTTLESNVYSAAVSSTKKNIYSAPTSSALNRMTPTSSGINRFSSQAYTSMM